VSLKVHSRGIIDIGVDKRLTSMGWGLGKSRQGFNHFANFLSRPVRRLDRNRGQPPPYKEDEP